MKRTLKKAASIVANSLFLDHSDSNVPMNGLGIFIKNIWAVINSDKEFHFPGIKEKVANFRCNEINDEAF